MADYYGAGADLFQGVMTGLGDFAQAGASREAGALYAQSAGYAKTEGALKDMMIRRQAFQVIGGAQADVGSSGFKMAGSALSIMRSNAQQASLARGINDINTRIQVNAYDIQSKEAYAAAQAQQDAGIGSIVGGVLGAAGAIFSDDTLKENITLMRKRADGLGIYRYNYTWDKDTVFEGVLASEVQAIYPDAVSYRNGWRTVDYDAIGETLRSVN